MSNARPLSPFELRLASELLDRSSDEFANHGCNDYELPDTDEAWQLLVDYEEWNSGEKDDVPGYRNGKTIDCADFIVMYALAMRLKECAEAAS